MTARRLAGLDALRGAAALAVVLYHITLRYPAFMEGLPTSDAPLLPGLPRIEAGAVPVLWFFLLSGFVVTGTVDRARSPLDFVVGRASRIYPAYWVSLLFAVAVTALWPLPGVVAAWPEVLVNMTMLQGWLGVPDVAGVYWSLAVEIMFYAYALAALALGQWRRVHWAVLAWSALAFGYAVAARYGIETSWRLGRLLLLPYAPYLGAGVALYHLWRQRSRRCPAATLVLCGATVLLTRPPLSAALCFVAAAVIAASAVGNRRWPMTEPLIWLGSVSYPLYLVHEYPSHIVMQAIDSAAWPHWIGMAAALACSVALAALISYGVERPALRAIRGWWRRQAAPGPAA